jgi:hypothetical protein
MIAEKFDISEVNRSSIPRLETGGTSPDALSTTWVDATLWEQIVDQLLRWKSNPDMFEIQDQPDHPVLATAIDYAVDQMRGNEGAAAPGSVISSGNGRIAMEWNDGPLTVTIEFTGLGVAEYTLFDHGKVHKKSALLRNPRSRQLELRG